METKAVPPVADNSLTPEAAQPAVQYDLEKAAAFKAAVEAQQSLPLAIVAGLLSALIGAAVWGAVTVGTGYQIGWMAVGVGFLVGIAVRKLGKGLTKPFGFIGAVCALLGCILGNLLSVCGFLSIEESSPFFPILTGVLMRPMIAFEIMRATMSPMDFLFYAIAMYEGYKFSFREITAEELGALTKPAEGEVALQRV